MSSVMSNYRRGTADHFEPDADMDPHAQRQLRGKLEQIDYTAYVSNREVIGQALGKTDAQSFGRLGVAAAQARVRWIRAAMAASDAGAAPSIPQIEQIAHLRRTYEELAEAYDALRRLVERGYVVYASPEKLG